MTTAPGSLPIAPPPGLGPLGHLVGIAVTAAALGAFLALARLIFLLVVAGPSIRLASVSAAVAVRLSRLSTAIRASSIGHSRWASPFVIACAVAAAARIWMCTWAPMLYPPDAMDYIRETTNFLATGHLENTGIRVLGISVYFAPFWKLFSDFNFALGIGNAVLGWLTAVLAGLIARRLMPRPIDAIVVAVVGLSPLLLAWERAAMSESPAAFISTLMFWLALRPGRWSVSEGRLAIAIPVAILMGLAVVAALPSASTCEILARIRPAAVLAAAWPNRGFRKALLLATLIAGTAFAGFLPRMNSIRHDYNRFAFAVGTEYAAGMLGWYSGLVDVDQTRVTDFATTRELLAELNGDGHDLRLPKADARVQTIFGPPYKNGITDVSGGTATSSANPPPAWATTASSWPSSSGPTSWASGPATVSLKTSTGPLPSAASNSPPPAPRTTSRRPPPNTRASPKGLRPHAPRHRPHHPRPSTPPSSATSSASTFGSALSGPPLRDRRPGRSSGALVHDRPRRPRRPARPRPRLHRHELDRPLLRPLRSPPPLDRHLRHLVHVRLADESHPKLSPVNRPSHDPALAPTDPPNHPKSFTFKRLRFFNQATVPRPLVPLARKLNSGEGRHPLSRY